MFQSPSSSLKKRVYITYITAEQKRELCPMKWKKPQPKNIELAQKYGISAGQVSDILKESDKWLSIDPNSYQTKLKRPRTSVVNIKDALILRILTKGPKICWIAKVTMILKHQLVGLINLSREEYNKHGESQSAPIEQIPQMREELKKVLMKYNEEDIFNCDETGLYWKPF